jgi:hypothetical protein
MLRRSRQNDGFEFHPTLLQRILSAIYRLINLFVSWDRLPTSAKSGLCEFRR